MNFNGRVTVQSGCSKKKCSDFDGSGTSRLESIKCGANLVSDEKVDFSRKTSSALICVFNSEQPQMRVMKERNAMKAMKAMKTMKETKEMKEMMEKGGAEDDGDDDVAPDEMEMRWR